MSYYNDPFGRYFRAQQPSPRRSANPYQKMQGAPQRQPTLDDYNQLVQAYQELRQEREALVKRVETTQEALRQQTKAAIDLKAELDEARAAAEQLQAELQDLVHAQQAAEEPDEWQDRYVQLQAETESYRRRLEQRSVADVERQRLQILQDMLPLADHLEMALQHLDRSPIEEVPEPGRNFRQNLEATRNAFLEALRKHGVQPIDPEGTPFDPTIHEAVGQMPHADVPEDHVAAVVRTGYLAGEQLLRPARVLVSTGT